MNFNIPSNVQLIIDTFYKNGYEAFMVGGCIRDLLLNKTPTDYDIATSAPQILHNNYFQKLFLLGLNMELLQYLLMKYHMKLLHIEQRKDSISIIGTLMK